MALVNVKTQDVNDSVGNLEPSSNPFSLKRYPPGVRKIASFGLTLYVIGLLVTTRWAPDYWVIATLCSSACMALGWAVGFLFGVPRAGSTPASARINTNLEQISDWLTKILVGVGLTQLQQLPSALRRLAAYVSRDFGKSGNDVFSLSMVLYFSTLGFLTGYLLTRLALQQEFDAFDETEKTQVTTTGSTKIEVTQPAAVQPDEVQPDADKTDADRADTGKADGGRADTGKADGGRADADKADGGKADADKGSE